MRLSIIADDKMVIIDGVAYSGLDLSFLDSDIWAVQWDTDKGHVEKRDYSVTEITDITPYNAAKTKWVEADQAAKATTPTTETDVRDERGNLLNTSDWTVLPDSPLSDSKIAEWKTYRQTLRDLPANTADWANPTYPTPPSV